MKRLRHKTRGSSPERTIHSDGSEFLREIARLVKADLARLGATNADEDWVRLARTMKIYSGNLDEKADPEKDGYNYLFLNVPSSRGFMLEIGPNESVIELRRGTLIMPLKRNVLEELEASTLFVTSPQIIETFEIRGPQTVRATSLNKTFTTDIFAEYLLTLAFGISDTPDTDES